MSIRKWFFLMKASLKEFKQLLLDCILSEEGTKTLDTQQSPLPTPPRLKLRSN